MLSQYKILSHTKCRHKMFKNLVSEQILMTRLLDKDNTTFLISQLNLATSHSRTIPYKPMFGRKKKTIPIFFS